MSFPPIRATVTPLSAVDTNVKHIQHSERLLSREAKIWWSAAKTEVVVLLLMAFYYVCLSAVEIALVGSASFLARRNSTMEDEAYNETFGNLDLTLFSYVLVLNYFLIFETMRYHWKSRAPFGLHTLVGTIIISVLTLVTCHDEVPKWFISVNACVSIVVAPIILFLLRRLRQQRISGSLCVKAMKRSAMSLVSSVISLTGIFYGVVSRELSNMRNFWVEVVVLGVAFPLLQFLLRHSYFGIIGSEKRTSQVEYEKRGYQTLTLVAMEPVFTLSGLLAILNLSTEMDSFLVSSLLSFAGEIFETWWLIRRVTLNILKTQNSSERTGTGDLDDLSHFLSAQQLGRKQGLFKLAVYYVTAGNDLEKCLVRLGLFLFLETISSMCKFKLMEKREGISWMAPDMQRFPWGIRVACLGCGALGYVFVEAGSMVQRGDVFR